MPPRSGCASPAILALAILAACAPGAPPKVPGDGTSADEVVVRAGDFPITVRAFPFANLAHQIDCLAGLIQCGESAVRGFWAPSWTPDDERAIAEWKEVRRRYDVSAELAGPAPASVVPLPHAGVEVGKALRLAALLARTPADFRRNVAVIVPPQDAERLVRVAERFRPRFDAFWQAKGSAVAARFAASTGRLLERPDVAGVVARAARFYAAPLPPGTPIDFDLVVLPGDAGVTHGEQMLAHGVVEVLERETPEARLGVVCHELFHFFYNARTPAQQAALANRIAGGSDPRSAIAYFLLDEAVATALGNGVVERASAPASYARRLARDNGFYNNHAIDATAKGLLARSGGDPTTGPPLDDPAFAAGLLAAAREAVGDDPRSIEYLHSFAVVAEEGWMDLALRKTRERASTNNLHDFTFGEAEGVEKLAAHPALSAVILAPRRRLPALRAYAAALDAAALATIEEEAARPGAFAYVVKRSPAARVFLVVADDARSAGAVADALFAQDRPVVGLFRPGP